MTSAISKARQEINKTLKYCNYCTRNVGISFIDKVPSSLWKKIMRQAWFFFSMCMLVILCIGEVGFVGSLLLGSNGVAAFVASLHIVGYGIMSLFKLMMLYFKRSVIRKVLNELVELWPVSVNKDGAAAALKQQTLRALRFTHLCYLFWNIVGVLFYMVTPIVLYAYRYIRGQSPSLGFVWHVIYPFDKTQPVANVLVYIFECFSGLVSVGGQLGSDLIFTAMASHISMLLRLLQSRIRGLGTIEKLQVITNSEEDVVQQGSSQQRLIDCYDEIVSVVKIHQRLINYSKDLEDVFSMVNLVNVLLSSVNICCVVFNIVLLESWMDMSNKLFLGAALTQVGIICWYADEIFRAILTTAYSYFTLLYTMYSN